MTYGWMLMVVAIVGGGIYGAVQYPDSEYDVTVDGYLTHDGERAELGYVEVRTDGFDCSEGQMLDSSTSARESVPVSGEEGDITFEFQARNSTSLRFCSASDIGGTGALIASRGTRIPHLVEETISNEYPTEGYNIVVEDVTIEPVSEVN